MFKKFLLIFGIYLLVRFIYGAWKLRSVVKKSFQEMNKNTHGNSTPEGEIRIKTKPKNHISTDKNDDYVDYEEID